MQPNATFLVMASAKPRALNPDRYFDSDARIRQFARAIYEETCALPLVSPHGHVDAGLLAENTPFPEPVALLITPDHYILRLLYSRGVPLEELGIARRDGAAVETDPRRIWQLFAEHYYLFAGTPTGAWLDYELAVVFGVEPKLTGATASFVYDQLAERLQSPEFLPRALFERFNIEVLATTNCESDALDQHAALQASGWRGRIVPTFRPDGVFRLADLQWRTHLGALERVCGYAITSFEGFVRALTQRRVFFQSMGANATDHAVLEPYTHALSPEAAERLFQKALQGEACASDQRAFEAHMLMEMARMSVQDGLVMQLHPGAWRDHNQQVLDRFGPDIGGDIPIATEYTRNLRELLNTYGNDWRLRLVVFTLDESTYARELAPLAGHYPAMRLGPPWWFHDSIEGMVRFRQQTTETASIYNTAGFIDDTRAFCSIPARHDLARRIDANYLAGLVARHVIDLSDASLMARALAYDLVRETYRLS